MRAVKNMILREIAGETVLIPVGENAVKINGMIAMSESGALLWKRLQQDCTKDDLIKSILAEYDIDHATASKDVDSFINQMMQVGILEE